MSARGDMDVNGDLVGSLGEHVHTWDVGVPKPGETCEACKRKVPHPRKESSPSSRTVSYRVPVDEYDAHQETLENAARWVGTAERPFSVYQTVALALAVLLQDEGLKGFAHRSAA